LRPRIVKHLKDGNGPTDRLVISRSRKDAVKPRRGEPRLPCSTSMDLGGKVWSGPSEQLNFHFSTWFQLQRILKL
jgi:hypothetical protein